MPQSKKKTAAKKSKSGVSTARKPSAVSPGGSSARKPTTRKPAMAKQAAPTKKSAKKKASAQPMKATASKKVSTTKAASKKAAAKATTANASSGKLTATQAGVQNTPAGKAGKASSRKEAGTAKTSKVPTEVTESKKEPLAEQPSGQNFVAKPASRARDSSRKKSRDSDLADSIHQGLAKQGHKKRGWRDIEALTERARLKNLLSDIWHEDIDLDSDIFGEVDQFSSYYTDKEEEIEVEDDDDEEWEEFEEDEN